MKECKKGPHKRSILNMISSLITKHSDILVKTIPKLISYLIIFLLIQNLDSKPKENEILSVHLLNGYRKDGM